VSQSVYSREYQIFLAQLRAARERTGLTQRDVASNLGKSQSFVAKVELGHNRLDVAQIVAYCRALSIPLLDFMKDYEDALSRSRTL